MIPMCLQMHTCFNAMWIIHRKSQWSWSFPIVWTCKHKQWIISQYELMCMMVSNSRHGRMTGSLLLQDFQARLGQEKERINKRSFRKTEGRSTNRWIKTEDTHEEWGKTYLNHLSNKSNRLVLPKEFRFSSTILVKQRGSFTFCFHCCRCWSFLFLACSCSSYFLSFSSCVGCGVQA